MKFVHYGKYDKISKEKFNPVENRDWIKPIGCLWASPIDCNYGWVNFYDNELRDNDVFDEKMKYCIEFTLKNETRIYIIDSFKDYTKLYENYGRSISTYLNTLDFEKVSKEYDAILLTDNGQYETRFSNPSLYGWDVATLLLFNIDCIDEQELKQ